MPNCFQLSDKKTGEPISLNEIDRRLCVMLAIPVHPTKYVVGWFDTIGWQIAVNGLKLGSQELRDRVANYYTRDDDDEESDAYYRMLTDQLLKCLKYLEEHFTSDAWVEIGRR